MSDPGSAGQQWREDFAQGALERMTDLQIRSELRETSAKMEGLRQRRDLLIRAALKLKIRPTDVASDSGLSRSRINQIMNEAESP